MFTGSLRRAVALLAVVGVVFAQMVVTAHACAVQGSASPSAAWRVATTGNAHGHPCGAGWSAPSAPQPVACEVHCTDATPLPAAADLPPIVLAALPPPAIAPLPLMVGVAPARTPHPALPGAPPLTLRFCRLLI